MIADLCLYINSPNTPEQVGQMSDMLIDELPDLTLYDFHKFFHNVKAGRYGAFYGQVNGVRLGEMLDKYLSERSDELIELNRSKQVKGKTPHLGIEQSLKEVLKKDEMKYEPRERTEQEKLLDGLIAEFDKLPVVQNSPKFCQYQGKILSLQEYIDIRISEMI
jgi:hypothetical protein